MRAKTQLSITFQSFILTFMLQGGAYAQLDFSISPTPVGSGARAAGMGDAFIAVADDATAASWNPAGLVQLERPELSIVSDWNSVVDKFQDNGAQEIEGKHKLERADFNFISYTYPISALLNGRNSVISLTYQNRYEFTRDFNLQLDRSFSDIQDTLYYNFKQTGGLGTISPAFAIELTEFFSIGFTINFWRESPWNESGWEQTFSSNSEFRIGAAPTERSRLTQSERYHSFRGENTTVGALWNFREKWNVSVRYDSKFEGDIEYKRITSQDNSFASPISRDVVKESRKFRLPATWAFGVSYRKNDRLTLSVQASRTDWNDFYITEADGTRRSLIDSTDLDNPATATKYDPTYSIRLGLEYVMIPRNRDAQLNYLWSIRGGLIYDEEPSSGRSSSKINSQGTGKPDRFYGGTFGLGLLVRRTFNMDIAYQFRFGDEVKSDRIRGLPGFSEDYRQHRVVFSNIVYF